MVKETIAEDFISGLFDQQPDAVSWLRPVFDPNNADVITDFEVAYCNPAAAGMAGTERAAITSTSLLSSPLMEPSATRQIFSQCLSVWQSGEPMEFTYHSVALDRSFHVHRSKANGGILNVTRDRTKEHVAGMQLQQQEKRYQKIIDALLDGVVLMEPCRDADGRITDFRIVYCNSFAIEVGEIVPDYAGKTLLQVLPHLQGSEQFALHVQVAEDGQSLRYETTFKTAQRQEYGWFIVSLGRVDGMVLSLFTDITQRKAIEEAVSSQATKLDRIINASLNAIFTCDAVRDSSGAVVDFRYTQINEMYKQMIGKSEEDVIGKTMLDIFPTAKKAGAFDKHCKVVDTGQPERFQVYYNGEGLDFWFDISSVKLEGDSVMVTFADITREKLAFLEIEEQKALLDNLFQHSPSGISIVEAIRNEAGAVVDFRNILLNDRAATFTGLPKEMLLTKTSVEIDPAFRGSLTYQMLTKTLETGEACYTDYQVEQTGKWIEAAVSKMDENRLICIVTDVTEARESQLRMQTLVEDLKRSNQSLEEFAYAASHDLQEPLRKIQFFSERLKKGIAAGNTADTDSLLGRMEKATTRMQTLIEDLLAYSQVSRKPDTFGWVELADVAEMVVQDFEPVITETSALLQIDRLPEMKGDERQLRQLLQNLLGNALKYRKPGIVPEIKVHYRLVQGPDTLLRYFPQVPKRAWHLLEVVDNGIGFEQEYAEKIFHVFTRLHGNNEYVGTGVGLAIVQKVVQNHNGFVAAESRPGAGATFRVLLPAL